MNKMFFNEYQALINSVAQTSILSDETLYNIANMGIYEGYNEYVERQLSMSEFTYEYIQVALYNSSKIDYKENQVYKTIKLNKSKLINNEKLFSCLREDVCKTDIDTIHKYDFLFDDSSPFITIKELVFLSELNMEDIAILSFVQPSLVKVENVNVLSDFFNRKYHNNTEAFRILMFIAKCNEVVARELFYSIDFLCFRYDKFSKDKKDIIKEIYNSILNLDDNENKVKFMKTTRYIDKELESEIFVKIKEDKDLCQKYIDAVNVCKTINKHTISVLVKLNSIYPMSEKVNDEFFENQKYTHYIVSKTIHDRCFKMEQGEKGEVLWPIYVEIFKNKHYEKTCSYMKKNQMFLKKFQDFADYDGMDKDARMQLVGVLQDSRSLENVLTYGEDFALQYFSNILGFKNYEAARFFVDIVNDNDKLKSSQELYDNTYEKLLDGKLKAKYTRNRNNIIKN